ncbi:hypothetical protein RSOLAG1IB_12070 [Rhizoctonia solani AG-1 IB]|nr:hypothetical protein RSOLAG1IB_12070 [Rhizoctonia solani AG-1 IB]
MIPDQESMLADVAGRSLLIGKTRRLCNATATGVNNFIQTKPTQGIKHHKRALPNPLDKGVDEAADVIRVPSLTPEAGHLTRRRSYHRDNGAGAQESVAPSQFPLNPAVPTLSPKNQPKHRELQLCAPAGGAGDLALSAQSRRYPPQAPPRSSQNGHPKATSQDINTHETLNHEGLVHYAQKEFGIDGKGCDTQTIISRLRLAQAQQTPWLGSSQRPPSIVMLATNPIKVGGGWSQNVIRRLPASSSSRKRASGQPDSEGSSKRQHLSGSLGGSTTEPEVSDELADGADTRSRIAAERIIQGCTDAPNGASQSIRPPQRGTVAPPPSRQSTLPTVIDVGSSHPSSRSSSPERPINPPVRSPSVVEVTLEDLLPAPTTPICDPTHARLRETLTDRYIDNASFVAPESDAAGVIQPTTTDAGDDRRLAELGGIDPKEPTLTLIGLTFSPPPSPPKAPPDVLSMLTTVDTMPSVSTPAPMMLT